MKKLLLLSLTVLLFSCGDSDPNALAKKRIFQKVDSDGMGMIKDLEIISVEKINDTTYKAVHTFTNPLIKKEMRIARNYFFTIDGETINNKEDITVEIKSAGEWVKSGL